VSTSGLSDANALAVVSMAIRRFCAEVGGMRFTRKLQVTGLFLPETFEGFHLEIVGSTNNDVDSDIAITSVGGSRITGTAMAAMLQVQIRAAIGTGTEDLTVTWSNFYFTIDAQDSTTIEISLPEANTTYLDATSSLFGGVADDVTAITGDFPEGCTVATALASGFRKLQAVGWGSISLREGRASVFINPVSSGTPAYYYVDNWSYLLLYPVPTKQEELTIVYDGQPPLSDTPATNTELPTEIPEEYQKGICNKVAEELLLGTHEPDLANRMRVDYNDCVRMYKLNNLNQNTDAQTRRNVYRPNITVEI